jgi:uncharacterized RDD family membrane protein YckC
VTTRPDTTEDVAPEPAGLFRLLAALVYDWLLLVAIAMVYALVVVAVRGFREVEPGTWWFSAGLVAVGAFYFAWCWTQGGRTLGMQAWRLRLQRSEGERLPGWGQALLRCVAAFVSLLPVGLGYWWMLFDRDRRSWHDRLSGTCVIYLRRRRK